MICTPGVEVEADVIAGGLAAGVPVLHRPARPKGPPLEVPADEVVQDGLIAPAHVEDLHQLWDSDNIVCAEYVHCVRFMWSQVCGLLSIHKQMCILYNKHTSICTLTCVLLITRLRYSSYPTFDSELHIPEPDLPPTMSTQQHSRVQQWKSTPCCAQRHS